MAKAAYVQRGEVLDYTNPSEDTPILDGDIVDFGTGIGVAGTMIPPGKTGSLHVMGVYATPKEPGEIAFGAALYYDAAAGTVSTAAGGTLCGYAAAEAGAADETVQLRLGAAAVIPVSPPAPAPEE